MVKANHALSNSAKGVSETTGHHVDLTNFGIKRTCRTEIVARKVLS